jgi:YD repeat-containing protein
MTEPLKISRKYTYDAENQVTSVTYEDGVIVSYTYDKAGNRISVTRSGSAVPAEPPSKMTQFPPVPAVQQVCGNCGVPLAPGKKFCRNCGVPASAPAPAAPLSVCTACGSPVRPGAKFCAKCGRKIT